MRTLAMKIIAGTFGVAVLIAILEHAGGFSQILNSAGGAYATGFNALTGHAGRAVAAPPPIRRA